jgi:hypothetical protein
MIYKIGQITAVVQDCRRVGIEESIIIEAIGPPINPKVTERAIDHLSDRLLALMDREEIGGAVLNFLIAKMIEACGAALLVPPPALIRLAGARLNADSFGAAHFRNAIGRDAFHRAAMYKIAHFDPSKAAPSQAAIARFAGVSRFEVRKWIQTGTLDKATAALGEEIERETGLPARVFAWLWCRDIEQL